jgi:hypothetical protein
LQAAFVSRVIDAEAYNAAVLRSPDHCPLLMAGDLRSGRQVAGSHTRARARTHTHTHTHTRFRYEVKDLVPGSHTSTRL